LFGNEVSAFFWLIFFGILHSKLDCMQSQNVADFAKILHNL
jgi:hypothetical protein